MTRQEANRMILKRLKGSDLDNKYHITLALKEMVEMMPDIRMGQMLTNWVVPDYRSSNPSDTTKDILGTLFPGNPDPFYEESTETLARLMKD